MSELRKKKAMAMLPEAEPERRNKREDDAPIDLYELLLKFLDKWYWIALCAIVGAVLALLYTVTLVTPQFKSTAKLYVVNKDSTINLQDLQISNYLAQDYTEVFNNWELHEQVIQELENLAREGAQEDLAKLGRDEKNNPTAREDVLRLAPEKYTYSKLSNMVNISNPSGTRILYITVTSPDRNEARILANAYAYCGSEFIAKRMATKAPQMFEAARTPTVQSSPSKTNNTILGFVIGAFLAMVVITLRYIMDDYVRTADDVDKYLHLPTLGTIMLQKQSDNESSFKSTHSPKKKKGEDKHGTEHQ